MSRIALAGKTDQSLLTLCGLPPDSGEQEKEINGLSFTVVFTTIPATLLALQRGNELARQLDARIRVLVPHVVPYPLPIDRPQVDPEIKLKWLRSALVDGAIEIRIHLLLCRDAQNAVMQGLRPRSVVLIGGLKRWWPVREQRLVRRLTLAGHHVIFVRQA